MINVNEDLSRLIVIRMHSEQQSFDDILMVLKKVNPNAESDDLMVLIEYTIRNLPSKDKPTPPRKNESNYYNDGCGGSSRNSKAGC